MQPPQPPGPEDPQNQPPYYGPPNPGQPYGNAPSYPMGPGGVPGQAPNNTLGLVSMILGIVAFPLLCCLYLGIPVGIAAAVLGFLGKKKADEGLASNRGQAMAGLICGIVASALGLVFILLAVVFRVVDLPTNYYGR